MELKSVSAFVCQVSDLNRTIKFYEDLGFNIRIREQDYARAYLNWFWIEFQKGKPAAGEGVAQYISVESTDETYKQAIAKGFKPEGEPQVVPQGRKEFTLKDPDGYKLVFFSKK